jgi:hypothetical protein
MKRVTKKKDVWKVGDNLVLTMTGGMPVAVKDQTLAVIVDGQKKFPRLFEEMICRVGYRSLSEDFVCVDWPNNSELPKGYYSRYRFVKLNLDGLDLH